MLLYLTEGPTAPIVYLTEGPAAPIPSGWGALRRPYQMVVLTNTVVRSSSDGVVSLAGLLACELWRLDAR